MSRYVTLFQVDILHDYFLNRGGVLYESQADANRDALARYYSVGDFLSISPDEPTIRTLAGHKMLFKTTAFGFFVAVQSQTMAAGTRPTMLPTTGFGLTFALQVRDARFFNYTELGAVATGFYRFGNDSPNEVAGLRFLSQSVRDFDPVRGYRSGELYASAAGASFDLFRAIRDTGPASTPIGADWERIPADTWDPAATYTRGAIVLSANQLYRALVDDPGAVLGNAADWQPVAVLANQYVTDADAVVAVSGIYRLDLHDSALPQATIRLLRPGQTTAAVQRTFAVEQGTLGEVQLDLRGLPPGLYRLDVLDDTLTVVTARSLTIYLVPAVATAGWFGAIDIGLSSGNRALLNPDGTLRSPRYTLRFLNRATRWRYIFPAAQPVGSGAEVAPEAGDDRVLVTAGLRALTRFGTGVRLQADLPATPTLSEEVLLPEPEINRIRRQSAQWYSDIHLPNLPLGR